MELSVENPWVAHNEKFFCDHPETVLCLRTKRNGVEALVLQCSRCGSQKQEVKRESVPYIQRLKLPNFDDTIKERWDQRRANEADRIRLQQHEQFEAQRAEYTEWYRNIYLRSPEWREKRLKVLERDGYQCQGCLENRATQVHHTKAAYEMVPHEMLFDLYSVCEKCHDRIHGKDEKS